MSAARPDTWMPLYWGDYAKDTGHLSAAHHGAYLMLIKHYWSQGAPLVSDDSVLWRIACANSLAHWRKLKPVVLAFFVQDGNLLRHRRIDAELENATGRMKKASDKAKKAAVARWTGQHEDIPESEYGPAENDAPSNAQSMPQASTENARSMGQAMLEDCPSQPQSESPSPLTENYTDHSAAASSSASARGVEDQCFTAWQAAAIEHGWPDAQFLTSNRRHKLQVILAACAGINGWRIAIAKAPTAEFLRDGTGWQRWFDLDWLLKIDNFTRLMEGRYAERHSTNRNERSAVLDGIDAAFARRSVQSE